MSERISMVLNAGVDDKWLKQMENEYPLQVPDGALYNFIESSNEQALVPVCKIKGGSRIEPNSSWINNFKDMGDRIDNLLDSIERRGLKDYVNSFQSDQKGEKIELGYYNNLDAYFVENGGNHRVTIAKIIGMETIKARVSRYEYQKDQEEKKHVFNWMRKQLDEKIKNLGFSTNYQEKGISDELEIFYKDKLIYIFDIPQSFNYKNDELKRACETIENLERIIEIKRSFPPLLSKIILYYLYKTEKYGWHIQDKIKTLLEEGYFNNR